MTTIEDLWRLRQTMLHLRKCSLKQEPLSPNERACLSQLYGASAIRLGDEIMQAQLAAMQRRH